MNRLIEQLGEIRTANAFEAKAIEQAITALEAADRMVDAETADDFEDAEEAYRKATGDAA